MPSAHLVFALLVILCGLPRLAQALRLPAPILLFVSGLLLGLMPQGSLPRLPPETILPLFLPPLLMTTAYYTSLRDLRANLRPILLLAVGLVAATTLALGATISWLVPGMPLMVGLVLGAIVSPPDAIAASSLMKQLRIPRRIVTILEGESLVNDATGLLLYQLTIAAVLSGADHFEPLPAAGHFAWLVMGGIGIGAALGFGVMRLFPLLHVHHSQILFTLAAPYLAYFAAEEVHSSGVLSVVAAGLVVGWMSPRVFEPTFRMPSEAVWSSFTHTLTALVFVLIGVESYDLIRRVIAHYDLPRLALVIGSCIATMVVVRFVWVYIFAYIWQLVSPKERARTPFPSWQNVFLIGWVGMRGVVSIATALAVPLALANGDAFPHRDLLLCVASALIFFSLVVQGGTLPWLVDKLSLTYDPRLAEEDWRARHRAASSAIEVIDEITEKEEMHAPVLGRIRSHYADRLLALGDGPHSPLPPGHLSRDDAAEQGPIDEHDVIRQERSLWARVLECEREAVLALRRDWHIGDDVMHDLLREIDMLAQRFTPPPETVRG